MAAAPDDHVDAPRGAMSSSPPPPLAAAKGATIPNGFGDRIAFCDHCCRDHRVGQHGGSACDVPLSEDDDAAEGSSTGSSGAPNPKVLRTFATDPPLQWSVFQRLRKSHSNVPTLSAQQESNVTKALQKVRQAQQSPSDGATGGSGSAAGASPSISDSLPFVNVFVQQMCPELKASRDGATFTILAVITGHTEILRQCLELGANPNDTRFMGVSATTVPNTMRHGFSPFFLACILEQVDCMNLLYKAGGSVHTFDRWGRTPLHAAAAIGSDVVIQWLLAHGAPRSVTDRDSVRPGEMSPGRVKLGTSGPMHVPALLSRRSGVRHPCPCHSGKLRGDCCCVDDMRERWYLDRVSSEWLPMEFIDVVSQTQIAYDSRMAAAATTAAAAMPIRNPPATA